MSRLAKTLLSTALRPFALLAKGPGEGLRRAWAHARVSAFAKGRVPSSAVILGVPEMHGTGHIGLGEDLYLYRDLYLETREHGFIEIGDGTVMSRGVHVVSFSGVRIGEGAMIGEYCSIRDANHVIDTNESIRHSGHDAAPITIGADTWIGRGVTVLSGVTIGDGAVIGANAVVTKDVPAGAIAVGIPARVVRERTRREELEPA